MTTMTEQELLEEIRRLRIISTRLLRIALMYARRIDHMEGRYEPRTPHDILRDAWCMAGEPPENAPESI